jgi:hypothetical protein
MTAQERDSAADVGVEAVASASLKYASGAEPQAPRRRRTYADDLDDFIAKSNEEGLPSPDTYAAERAPNLVFFRRSEVMLYFEGPGAQDLLHSETGQLLDSLRKQKVPVHEYNPFTGPSGRREPLLVRRNGQVRGVLHVVNLSKWLSEEERRTQERDDNLSGQQKTELAEGYKEVADTVTQLNKLAVAGLIDWGDMKLTAAGPNWLVGPLISPDCGPAGRPRRPKSPSFDPSKPPRYRSTDPGASPLPFSGTGRRIMVALFDTWPADMEQGFHPLKRISDRAAAIAKARADAPAIAPPANTRLTQMGSGAIIPPQNIEDFVHPVHNAGWVPVPYGCANVFEEAYDMADHGLFIADIINDIAPQAEIHVYRVFNHKGLGDLEALAHAVQHAIDEAQALKMPLILSLSVGISPSALLVSDVIDHPDRYYLNPIQVADDIMALTSPTQPPPPGQEYDPSSAVALLRAGGLIDPDKTVNRFIGPLSVIQKLFDQVEADNVLAIAAAGNDSCGDNNRFNPKLPAAIDGVLAVSAFAGTDVGNLQLADYSNTDDFFADSDGVGAYGGSVNGFFTADGDAPIGLYSEKKLASDTGNDNDCGWAEWSGTSFATPVVTGVAACLWSEDVTQSATDVRVALQKMSTAQTNDYLPFMQQR